MLRIRTLSLAAALIAGGALPSLAADYGYETPADPFSAPAGFTWTGPYVGAIAGYGWNNYTATSGLLSGRSAGVEGGKVGAFGGYNYQFNNQVVAGVEADLNWDDVKGSANLASANQTWDSTLRGRIGYSFGRVMAFGTGGAAVSGNRIGWAGYSSSATHWGYALGGGVEGAITNNIIARVEYQYADFGSQLYRTGVGSASDVDFNANTLRAGVGYKF